ncbi:hypothetical protein UA69_21390, partial [Photobacterium angustum]
DVHIIRLVIHISFLKAKSPWDKIYKYLHTQWGISELDLKASSFVDKNVLGNFLFRLVVLRKVRVTC